MWTWRAPLSAVVDVGSGCLGQGPVIGAAEALGGGLELTRPGGQPLVVVGPPASVACGGPLGPRLGGGRVLVGDSVARAALVGPGGLTSAWMWPLVESTKRGVPPSSWVLR